MLVAEKEKIYNEEYVKNTTPLKTDETYKEFKEFKKENLKNQRLENKKIKLSALKSVMTIFVIGMVIMVRYSVIYANQKQIRNMKQEISTIKYKNDDLKVYLMQYHDIKKIDSIARNKFKMVEPSITDTYYYDLSKDNFKDEKGDSKGINNIFEKIKNILF